MLCYLFFFLSHLPLDITETTKIKLTRMKKLAKSKLFLRVFAGFFAVFLSFGVATKPVHAFTFDLETLTFDIVSTFVPQINIIQTVFNIGVAGLFQFVPVHIIERNLDEIGNCGIYNFGKFLGDRENPRTGQAAVEGLLGRYDLPLDEGQTLTEVVDEAITKGERYEDSVCEFNLVSGNARGSGTLMKAGLMAQNYMLKEPPPVSLAYYFRDYARRVPIIKDTAYAQSYPYVVGGNTFILDIWKTVRNVSYGIIAIAMLVIGIMIMTRKKINPQVVVTVQNAIPRVVLALILITFSYPIGATLASLSIGLSNILPDLFFLEMAGDMIDMNLIPVLISLVVTIFGSGTFAIIAGLTMGVVSLVIGMVALIKTLFIYVKLIFAIIVSPIQFAIGAIPGNEDSTWNWFRKTSANMLAIPGMFFMIYLGWYLLFRVLTQDILSGYGEVEGGLFEQVSTVAFNIGSQKIIVMFAPFMMMMCFMTAIKMPKMLQGWIVGDDRKRKK